MVSRNVDGGLLQELFTRDGEGFMICKDIYEGVRTATSADVPGIMRLIKPLNEQDILVSRNAEMLEANVSTFSVIERDGAILACASLTKFEDDVAEISCVAVDPEYQKQGLGNALLGYVLRRARSLDVRLVFALTTRTAHWFVDRGFDLGTVADLPQTKRAMLDVSRNSKVYLLDISTPRSIDEKELLLNV